MKFLGVIIILVSGLAYAHGPVHTDENTKRVTLEIDGETIQMEIKEVPFDMDQDVNMKSALQKLGHKIHEGLEGGDHDAKGLAAIAAHFASAVDIKGMATKAVRFVNASNRSERWRDHIKNLVFLSFLTHGYEMSSSFVNYYAARSMGAGDAAAYGAAAVGLVMAVPFFVDFVCWGGYLGYAAIPPFRGLVQVLRTVTVRVSVATAKKLRINRLQDLIMETISDPEVAPSVRTRNMEMVGSLTSKKLENGRLELSYSDPKLGSVRLETEKGMDSKFYVRRMIISEGIANAWLSDSKKSEVASDLAGFRKRILKEFKAYGFNVKGMLKETLSAFSDGKSHDLIHRFYVEGAGQTVENKIVVDLIPDAVHLSKARIVYPWEALKSGFRRTCSILTN